MATITFNNRPEVYTTTSVTGTDTFWYNAAQSASTTINYYTTNSAVFTVWCDGPTITAGEDVVIDPRQDAINAYIQLQERVARRQAPARTPEEMAAREAQEREQRAAYQVRVEAERLRYAEAERKQKEAEARAETLLVENLRLQQRNDYLEKRHFDVVGRSGTRYRVHRGTVGNIDVVGKDGVVRHRLCGHPQDVPVSDVLLAQKLMLEHDDNDFVKRCNRHAATRAQIMPALVH